MTDNEIKTYLPFIAKYCKDEYNDIRVDEVLLGAFDLINRQSVEIEKLKKVKAQLETDNFNEHMNYEVLKNNFDESEQQLHYLTNVEIPYLYSFTEDKDKKLETLANILLGARKKAIKEFADKLKSIAVRIDPNDITETWLMFPDKVDNLVKQFTEKEI